MSKLLSPLFTDLKFRTIGTSRATAEKFYYDKRHLSYIRLQTTKESNRDPRKRERDPVIPAPGDPAVAGPSGVKAAVVRKVTMESSSEEEVSFQPAPKSGDTAVKMPTARTSTVKPAVEPENSSEGEIFHGFQPTSSTNQVVKVSSTGARPDVGVEMSPTAVSVLEDDLSSNEGTTEEGLESQFEKQMRENALHTELELIKTVDTEPRDTLLEEAASFEPTVKSADIAVEMPAAGSSGVTENSSEDENFHGFQPPKSTGSSASSRADSDYSNPSSETMKMVRETIGKSIILDQNFNSRWPFYALNYIFFSHYRGTPARYRIGGALLSIRAEA